MENISTRKYYPYLDILRIISAYFIIIRHITASFIYNFSFSSPEFIRFSVYNVSTMFAVPVFFMISGSLILQKEYGSKDLLKKILQIFIPYIIFGIVEFWDYFISFLKTGNMLSLNSFLQGVISNNTYRWFMLAIIGLYILSPVLKYIANNSKLLKYSLIILFVFSVIIKNLQMLPIFESTIGMFHGIGIGNGEFSIFIFYFLFGYYLNNMEIRNSNKNKGIALVFFALSLIIAIVLYIKISQYSQKLFIEVLDLNRIWVVVSAASIFYLAKQVNIKSAKFTKALKIMGEASFGIYLLHSPIIKTLTDFNLYHIVQYRFMIPSTSLLIFIICLVIVLIVKWILNSNKYLKKIQKYIF